jgi:sugar porter (SP) family MFS transporter
MSRTLLFSSLVAALGGLLFGFDTAVISGAEQDLQKLFQPVSGLSETAKSAWHGLLVASALIGTIVGAIASGRPADAIGRRATMKWIAVIYFISAIGTGLAWDWYSFVVFRFIGGLGVGGASVVSPMYIAEIAPAKVRGRLVALAQFNIVFGVLLAFCSNYLISEVLPIAAEVQWRWMMGIMAFPAAAYFLLLFLTPRSPRWLLAKGYDQEARHVLQRVGVDEQVGSIDAEVAAIKQSLEVSQNALSEPFFQRKYLRPIMLAVAIAAFNQLSGINAVWYFSKRIFESVGYNSEDSLLASIGLGLINLVFTMAALLIIDNFGRRKLMLVGSIGYIVSLSATAWAFYAHSQLVETATGVERQIATSSGWLVMLSLLVFVSAHAFGQGAVIWVFISEIFPTAVRARGQALGSFTHWAFAAVITYTFPLIAERSGGHVFAFYAVCMVGQLLWVLFVMPETKGVSLEKIEQAMEAENATEFDLRPTF